jgi:N-acetylmuramoyl-L-alanine amidase
MTFSIALLGMSSQGSAKQLAATGSSPRLIPALAELTDANLSTQANVPAASDEEADFTSLADAVAAHDAGEIDEATRCLAGAIYFESKGEPLAGQLAVAEVIINRAKSGRYPSNLCDVITQRGQFGFVRAGRIPSIDEGRTTYRTALAVARVALADAWDGPAPAALYFNTPGNRPGGPSLVKVAAVGNHVFWR